MFPISSTEKLIETKICKQCQSNFPITNKDLQFYDKISPVFAGKKYQIPTPTLCPDCRMCRRMAFRNERTLYTRKCDKTGTDIVSMHRPGVNFPVYQTSIWWSDEFDATQYAMDRIVSVPFMSQFADLIRKIPRAHIFNYAEERQVNSVFTNCAGDLKDCYLIFGSQNDENCHYCTYVNSSNSCIDCFFGLNNTVNYECIDTDNCFNVFYCYNCLESKESTFLVDCQSCTNCIWCVGLRHKKYYIWNKKATKEEYDVLWANIFSGNIEDKENFRQKFLKFSSSFPRRYMQGDHNDNSTGNYLYYSHNTQYCFDTKNAENCKYCGWCVNAKDVQDFYAWWDIELSYEVVSSGENQYQCAFTTASWGNKRCFYIDLCHYCEDCFGCVGLKNKKYCILNKQYSKEHYEELVSKIIKEMRDTGEWGEFFHPKYSPYGINETVAIEYFPMKKQEAISLGFNWCDYESPKPQASRILTLEMMKKLPKNIQDIPDDILQWALTCEDSEKLYKITKPELEFYRKHNLPIPRKHPDQRHKDRMSFRNPRKLIERTCDKCNKNITTSFIKSWPEKVYCEECYGKEIV